MAKKKNSTSTLDEEDDDLDVFLNKEFEEEIGAKKPSKRKNKKERDPVSSSEEEEEEDDEDESSSSDDENENESSDEDQKVGEQEDEDEEHGDEDESDNEFEEVKLAGVLEKLNQTLDTKNAEDGQWKTTTNTYQVRASLNQLSKMGTTATIKVDPLSIGIQKAKSQSDTESKISEEVKGASLFAAEKTNGGKEEKKEEKKEKKAPTTQVIGSMDISAYKNDFPATISMDVQGLNLNTTQSFSGNGVPASCTFLSETSSTTPINIVERSNVKIQNKFFEEYPGRNLGNIRDGIEEFKKFDPKEGRSVSTGDVLVDDTHPVVPMFEAALKAQKKTPLSDSNRVDHKFKLQAKSVDKLMNYLVKSMEKQTQVHNVDDFKFEFSRAFTSANTGNVLSLNNTHLKNGLSNNILASDNSGTTTIESRKESAGSCKSDCAANGWADKCEVFENTSGAPGHADKLMNKVHVLTFSVRTKYKEV